MTMGETLFRGRRAWLQRAGGLALAAICGERQCCPATSAAGRLIVSCRDLVLKDTGKPDPAFLQRLFDGVDSKQIGLTLDANNFYWYGWPLQRV
jgi:hypothetical protein